MSNCNYENMSVAFNADKKKMIKTETLVDFISNRGKDNDGLDEDVISVPGIGPVTSEILQKNGFKKVYHLVNKFVALEEVHGIEAQIEFKKIILSMGVITPHVKTIVSCISHKSSSVCTKYHDEKKKNKHAKKKIELMKKQNKKKRNYVICGGVFSTLALLYIF